MPWEFGFFHAGASGQPRGFSELPSVSLTSVSSAHFIRVSSSPPLFVKRWTSLALWKAAVSPTGERESEREKEGG